MPCNCEHMEPSYDEMESKKVCELLCILYRKLSRQAPLWVRKAAEDYYGAPRRITVAEELLYKEIKRLDKKTFESCLYNARSRGSRRLANWFEDFDEKTKDERRRRKEKHERKKRAESLLAKMRKEEVEILREYLRNH